MLNLALTSDLPSTANPTIFNCMRKIRPNPRIAWVAPFTKMGREHFPPAQDLFDRYGYSNLEYCDIDAEPDEAQLANLDQYDIIYLTGGDPIGFRHNILHTGLSMQLRKCLAAGRLIVGASGGSMQLTKGVSLYRLMTVPLADVLANRSKYEALGIVGYEILPHLNRFEPSFLELVQRYSEHLAHDVLALTDGAALLYANSDEYMCIGRVTRFRTGVITEIGTAD